MFSTNHDEIYSLIVQEQNRQEQGLVLIASENYCNSDIRQAVGSVLTNKYAEGYPGKRYYSGCLYIDKIECETKRRFEELFGAEHANVQPHAGSQANFAVYNAVLKPGDVILSMDLASGGHLTHGHSVNASGTLYTIVSYGVDPETEQIDMSAVRSLAQAHKPKLIIAGASAYSRHIDFAAFAQIAQEVGAYLLADIAHIAGLVAVGLHQSPVSYADFVTFTTHKTFAGPRGAVILCKKKHAKKIDFSVMPGMQGGPFMHVIAAKGIACMQAMQPGYAEYQRQVVENARVLAQVLAQNGLRIVSGGTDNHLFLVDLTSLGLSGKQAEKILQGVGIYVNRNTIPFDTKGPLITSGIRIGTPAITMRGAQPDHMHKIGELVVAALQHFENSTVMHHIALQVRSLTSTLDPVV